MGDIISMEECGMLWNLQGIGAIRGPTILPLCIAVVLRVSGTGSMGLNLPLDLKTILP